MRIAAHGVATRLPEGWEGSIVAEPPDERGRSASSAPPRPLPVAHFATFGLPGVRDDFGAAAVELMSTADALVCLVEYDSAEAGSALFSRQGLPRKLDPRAFSPRQLQRTLAGHAGLQLFFSEQGRAFCLYVVLGDVGDAHRLVRRVEQVLAEVVIEPLEDQRAS